MGVIKWWIRAAAYFHDVLHEFQVGLGTGTASLKSKMTQNMMTMREEVLYEVFLNLRKAFNTLNREQCMNIIVGNGIGPRTERII